MPANRERLIECLIEMKNNYLANPTAAVRSQAFINKLHDYCVEELISSGFDKNRFLIQKEATLYGSHKKKDVDIAVIDNINGPQVIIGIRSQMSSVSKNILTYYEEIIGDCISLHDRFPMAIICYVYLLPTRTIKPDKNETIDLNRAEKLFKIITDRGDWRNTKDKYEHFAFLKVDFTTDPPTLLDVEEPLSIDSFFDKIVQTYNERNIFDPIK